MYLSMLNNEKKHLFLELELYIAKADDNFSEQEKTVIDAHCIEMHIDNNNYENELSFDELLLSIHDSFNKQESKIAFLELTAAIIADDLYHESERIIVDKIAKLLDVSEDEIENAFSIVRDLKSCYERCAAFIA